MKPLVSVWMVTYNHEKYIAEALESVLMQQTNFDFEIVIGEDCSTDQTRSIIKNYENKYPNIIFPIYHDKNVGANRNAYEFTFPLCKGKYIACLEGDDYWTDPFKLQKQVDFLEQNKDYVICGHWRKIVDEKSNLIINENDFKINHLSTQCVVFRNRAFDKLFLKYMEHPSCGETFLYYYLYQYGRVKILPFFGANYRHSKEGVWSLKSKEKQFKIAYEGRLQIQNYFKEIKNETLFDKITVNKSRIILDFGYYLIENSNKRRALYMLFLFNKELFKISLFSCFYLINFKLNTAFILKLIK